MALGGRKGELVAVIDCGINHLDGGNLVSNVTRIRDKIRYFLEQD